MRIDEAKTANSSSKPDEAAPNKNRAQQETERQEHEKNKDVNAAQEKKN